MKILIIEDDPATAAMMEEALSLDERTVYVAFNPKEAIDVIDTEHIDLIISDWDLKADLSGIQVCELIKSKNKNVVVIMVSGSPLDLLKVAAVGLAPFALFAKPVDLNVLEEKIQALKT